MQRSGISKEGFQRLARVGSVQKTSQGEPQMNSKNSYYEEVKAIAEGIRDEFKEYGTDVRDMVQEAVVDNENITQYAKTLDVLQNSDNVEAIYDADLEMDASGGWQSILVQVAFYAMLTDVEEALSDLGFDGEGFDDAEEEMSSLGPII